MAIIQPLFSGSSGNAVLIESRTCALLVDAGVSGKRIISALEEKHKSPSAISGIFITHEHTDHIHSAGSISRRYHIPIYANVATWEAMLPSIGDIPPGLRKTIEPGEECTIGDIRICPFSIPHDAAFPVGYNFFIEGNKYTVATDIGKMSEKLFLQFTGCAEILLEANYDIVMLQKGKYPYPLKQRILSDHGHLSNKEAAAVCARLASLGTKQIILGHLSKDNNTPALAYDICKMHIESCGVCVGEDIRLSVAKRG